MSIAEFTLSNDLRGQAYALLAALTWAFAMVLFKRSGEKIEPFSMNLFKNIVASVLLVGTLAVTRDGFGSIAHYPREDVYLLIISGVLGIALADTAFFYSLNIVGVSMFSIIDCTYSPTVVLMSWFCFSEDLTIVHYVGGGLILLGLFVSAKHPPPADRTKKEILLGMSLGVLAIVLMAVGVILFKPVVESDGYPLVWATTIRLVAGSVMLSMLAVASPARRRIWSVFRPAPIMKYSLPAAFLGSYLAMVFWIGGFKYAQTAVVAVLNQTSVIFAMILAILLLKERVTGRKAAAAVLAVFGVMLVVAADFINRLLAGWAS